MRVLEFSTFKFEKVNFTWSFLEVNPLWRKLISQLYKLDLMERHLPSWSLCLDADARSHWLQCVHRVVACLFFLLIYFSCVFLSSSCLSPGNSILHSAADSVTSAVQKASQALNERGERLGRAEERTADMMNSAEQFAVTAHKVKQYTTRCAAVHYVFQFKRMSSQYLSLYYYFSWKIKHLT